MHLSAVIKRRVTAGLMIVFFLFSSLFIFRTVRAIPVEMVLDVPSALTYLTQRAGTILIQNIGRKVINEFAYDAATYVGSGGQGQKALFVKEKWSNFWQAAGDKAVGDFIETFANTVLNDIAGSEIDKEQAAACTESHTRCISGITPSQTPNANKITADDCNAKFKSCMALIKPKCTEQLKSCKDSCSAILNYNEVIECDNRCKALSKSCSADNDGSPVALGSSNPLTNINICNPSFDAGILISFGLMDQPMVKAYDPRCSFSEMRRNWQSSYDQLVSVYNDPDYLEKLGRSFDPAGNDLGVTLKLKLNLLTYRGETVDASKKILEVNKGWLDVRNFSGDLMGTPGEAERRQQLVNEELFSNIDKVTGDIFVDAANIFLNQLAVTGWQNLTGQLVDDTRGSSPINYWSGAATGRQAIENKITKIKDPVFSGNERLDVLSKLTVCEDPQNPAPTSCVIDNNFSDAISSKLTVAEALSSGRLHGEWPFGFDKNGQENLSYTQGYPYRSMLILRRYRILPVGWEIAAQKLQLLQVQAVNNPNNNPNNINLQAIADGVSLNDMISCFQANDQYNGYYDNWCQGLVDPNWVLKLSDTVCTSKGYGPMLTTGYQIQDLTEKSCGQIDRNTGYTNRVLIDGVTKVCSIDTDCCTRQERQAQSLDPDKPCIAKCNFQEAKLTLTRDNKYCADERSCLKTDSRGTCLANGYCTKERRQWVFDQGGQDQSCEPVFNTCKTFKSTKGKPVAYLENTLDFSMCNANSSGCKSYAIATVYDSANSKIDWSQSTANVYLNGRAKKCDARDEGCHEFIKVNASSGTNLIGDGDFETNLPKRWDTFGTLYNKTTPNYDELYLNGSSASLEVDDTKLGLYYGPSNKSLLVKGFDFEIDQTYTLSASIYVESGMAVMGIGNQALNNYEIIKITDDNWAVYDLTVDNQFVLQADSFFIKALGNAKFYIDNVKFEIGTPTTYSSYGANQKIYQKLMPDYLTQLCYLNPPSDYSLKANAPAICNNFVRRCNKDEAGCELYSDVITKDTVAAKVKPKDYCPEECVGFESFIQQENNFFSSALQHFIPRTAKSCTADQEGCTAFVNLDKVVEGGEDNQYFAEFRRCIKPDDTCGDFYTWEGSDASGYQLTAYKLQTNQVNTAFSQPITVVDQNPADDIDTDANGSVLCSEEIFKYPADHPLANSDCRQFYSKDGNISYHLYAKTVICVNDCFFYKQVDNNYDETITTEADCRLKAGYANGIWQSGFWLDLESKCAICRNGGAWDSTQNACVYKGWAEESRACSKANSGCSKYVGDAGHNVRVLLYDTFENNNTGAWHNNETTPVNASISSDALSVGGHSLKPANGAQLYKSISGELKVGKKYVLSFDAKSLGQGASIGAVKVLVNNQAKVASEYIFAEASALTLSNRFKSFKFAIDNINGQFDMTGIVFSGLTNAEQLRLDNIKLIEVEDVYFLIKNSWQTPESCNQDHRGRPFPLYMLGCRQYTDRDKRTHNLRSFDELCQESAAGCQLMIDTMNSSAFDSLSYRINKDDGTADAIVTVPEDEMAYVVYDKQKTCNNGQKGCQQLGLESRLKAYSSVFLLNNPDTYKDILCSQGSVGCESWTSDNVTTYFKEPGDRVCEYLTDNGGSSNWYQAKQQFCFSSVACSTDADCSNGAICLADEAGASFCSKKQLCGSDDDCATGDTCRFNKGATDICDLTAHQTIGLGVYEDKQQPIAMGLPNGNAGLCPVDMSGCTEYIDPESRFNFDKLSDLGTGTSISLNLNKLYILKSGAVNNLCQVMTLSGCNGANIYQLNRLTNEMDLLPAGQLKTACGQDANGQEAYFSEEFYLTAPEAPINSPQSGLVTCNISGTNGTLKEAVVAYRLKSSLNKNTPNEVNFDKGQILFNERSQNGKSKKGLEYNTNLSYIYDFNLSQTKGGTLTSASTTPGNNSNLLLQVDADRVCAEWLDCKTYINNPLKPEEKICIERGLCDSLNDAGECSHFMPYQPANASGPINQLVADQGGQLTKEALSNMTGYSKVGIKDGKYVSDLYHLAGMQEQGGAKIKVDSSNGSFEGQSLTQFRSSSDEYVIAMGDPRIIEKELGVNAYQNLPDGQYIAKTSDGAYIEIDNPGTQDLVASASVFIRTGGSASLTVGPIEVATTKQTGQWVRLVGRFQLNGTTDDKVKIQLSSDGLMYFDDVRIEPALNYRSDGVGGRELYMHSVCRLFPMTDSLSCDYFDAKGLRRKGWSGYCLEYDPRNQAACLMWYPLDKVASDEFEEGAGLSIANDLYYCVDAEDRCSKENPTQPEFMCKTFVKVDKDKYWYTRISEGSGYVLDRRILRADGRELAIDFGVDSKTKTGGKVIKSLNSEYTDSLNKTAYGLGWKVGSGFYGAYNSNDLLGLKTPVTLATNKREAFNDRNVLPVLAYYGESRAAAGGKEDEYFCRATIDGLGKDLPLMVHEGRSSGTARNEALLGSFDSCYVGIMAEYDAGNGNFGLNKVCNAYDYAKRRPGIYDTDDNEYTMCDDINVDDMENLAICGFSKFPCKAEGFRKQIRGWEKFGEPEVECKAFNKDINKIGEWWGETVDYDDDDDESGCWFDCFNHFNKYEVASSADRVPYAIQRLFTDVDETFVWNGASYVSTDLASSTIQVMEDCNVIQTLSSKDGRYIRPGYNPKYSKNDYCFIRPQVFNVSVNPRVVTGQGYVAISFNSIVDAEQIPLRRVQIFKNGFNNESFYRTLSIYDRPSPDNPHKFLIHYDASEYQVQSIAVKPCVVIRDNWGYESDESLASACSTDSVVITQK